MTAALAEAVKRDACPLRRSFFERPDGSTEATPLSALLRAQSDHGGKGAALRVSLLLSVLWLCAREPYSTSRVAAYWAELLDRPDPRDEGARAIRDCLHDLQDRGFLHLRAAGSRIEILPAMESRVRDVLGRPKPYAPPYGEAEAYITVPRVFWTSGLAGSLSGAGLAMYLVSLAMTRHDRSEFFLVGAFFDERFGISRSSRKRGLSELVERGVLEVRVQESIDLKTFRKVRRNIYNLTSPFLQLPPRATPEGAAPSPTSAAPPVSGVKAEGETQNPQGRRSPRRDEPEA